MLRTTFPKGLPPLAEPETFVRGLSREGRQLLEAYEKVLSGEAVTPAESQLLNAAGRVANELPEISRPLPVPSHRALLYNPIR